jgi:hypothetical protein
VVRNFGRPARGSPLRSSREPSFPAFLHPSKASTRALTLGWCTDDVTGSATPALPWRATSFAADIGPRQPFADHDLRHILTVKSEHTASTTVIALPRFFCTGTTGARDALQSGFPTSDKLTEPPRCSGGQCPFAFRSVPNSRVRVCRSLRAGR